jgi:antibiotic biosynthesis monooxygenase (ABM) superfamily enzyme
MKETSMTDTTRRHVGPTHHQEALMVWIAVLPTLTVLQVILGDLLAAVPTLLRPPIMATFAVPFVVYVLMPRLQRLCARLIKE